MSNRDIYARVGVVVAIVIAIIGWFTPFGQSAAHRTVTKFGTILDTFTGDYFQATTGFQLKTNGVVSTALSTSGVTINGLTTAPNSTTCNTASSTVFAIGPFGATTTLAFSEFYGTEGATTTDILVATSTTPSPAIGLTSTSTLGATVLNLAAVAAGSQFFSEPGITAGPGKGYTNPKGIPGSLSLNQQIVLGPLEYLIGFSTSTAVAASGNSGGTGVGQVAVPASCTFKYEAYSIEFCSLSASWSVLRSPRNRAKGGTL